MRSMKKLFVGMTAAAIAASCMAMQVSAATTITDLIHPDESDATMNDAYYGLCGAGYYMPNGNLEGVNWKWNQGSTINIDDNGDIAIEYKINKALTDTTMEGKGSLGEMGFAVWNLDAQLESVGIDPATVYPVAVTVKEAKFVAEDGTETVFNDLLATTEMPQFGEGNVRFQIRPEDAVDEDTGEVTCKATPEVEGWQEEGAFQGGTLYITVNFGTPNAAGGDSSAAGGESSAAGGDSSKADESSKAADDSSKTTTTTTTTKTTGGTTAAAGGGSDATDTAAATGATAGLVFAGIALAGAAVVVTKRK